MEQKIGERQRWAWLTGGLSAAIGICGCGLGWLWVLAGGLVVGLYYIYMDRVLPSKGLAAILPKIPAVLTILWTVAAMAWSANLADSAFPMVDGFPFLGWTILALAAWGSWKGPAACARCAGVLCLFLFVLYGVVGAFAIPDAQADYLKPAGRWTDSLWTAGLFLLPAGVWYLPCGKNRKKPAWAVGLLLPLATAALAAVTAGVLSPLLAGSLTSPLYTLAQSVSLFGVVERIEPLLSAAMTMGVFCLLSVMACACRALADRLFPWKWSGAAACAVAATAMGAAGKLPLEAVTVGSLIVWVLLPVIFCRKNLKNRKKPVDKGGFN